MEGYNRRSRRSRGHLSCGSDTPCYSNWRQSMPQQKKPGSGVFQNVLVFAGLMAVIYLMMEYHCETCYTKKNLHDLSKSIEEIGHNLLIMKTNYRDLELRLSKYSRELPMIQGQIETLEALSESLEKNPFTFCPYNTPMYNYRYMPVKGNGLNCIKAPKENSRVSVPIGPK